MSLKNIIEVLKTKNNFLVTSHINLEGDAIGSQLAIAKLLKTLNKKVVIVDEDTLPEEYQFLPESNLILTNPGNFNPEVIIFVDCSGFDRVGRVIGFIPQNRIILNIDHHISNNKFGTVNWIDPKASACVEMIYKIYKAMKIPLNYEAALYLYTGLLTDTGSFRYSNTTRFSHLMAADLMRFDIPLTKIYRYIYESNRFSDIKFLSQILPTLKKDKTGRIAWFIAKRKILRKMKTSFDISENLLNVARSIKGVDIALVFKEMPHKRIRVNFRSQNINLDVNKLAQYFGGGGHPGASGATISGKLSDIERRVLRKAREILV
ncbi:MAG: bifunctional oligoribonuclease/PAP phosphatase NrnA [Candidatus Omnitrophota bacterium]